MLSKSNFYVIIGILCLLIFPYTVISYNNMGEDEFISFRYVHNFINGNGLVYNIGERVEGYSNFLWVMALSLPALFGGDLLFWSKLGGIICIAGMMIISGRYFMDSTRRQIPPILLLAPITLFFNPMLHYNAHRGLETCFYSFLLLAAVYTFSRGLLLRSSLLFGLVSLTRPEGIFHFGIFCTAMILFLLFGNKGNLLRFNPWLNNNKKNIIHFFIPCVVLFGLFIVWRLLYYGQIFPNTVYAKTSMTNFFYNSSLSDLLQFVKSWSGVPLAALLIVLVIKVKGDIILPFYCSLIAVLSLFIFIIFVGRVQASPFQHFIPLIPFIVLIIQGGIYSLYQTHVRYKYIIIAGSFILIMINFYTENNLDHPASRIHIRTGRFLKNLDWKACWECFNYPPIHHFAATGRWISENLPSKALLAADQMGQLGYYAPQSIIDLLGLMDRHISHYGLDWEYIKQRNPDYIIPFAVGNTPYIYPVKDLTERSEFKDRYELTHILVTRYPEKINHQFLVYSRRQGLSDKSPQIIPIGATREEWEKYWRF